MAQNIYDNPDFFAGYSQLPRQVHGLDGAPEWPAIRAMLPDLVGKRVVDLGCGFGWASRWMREQGAASVLGLDLSQNMIERARADTADTAIEYRIADLDTLDLPEAAFDLAYSALTFHYVQDFGRLVHVIRKTLVPDGHFVFTIEHPIFMAAAHPHWISDEEGRKTWPVNRYSVEGERRTDWFAKRSEIPQDTWHYLEYADRRRPSNSADRGVCPNTRADPADAAIGRRTRTPHDADCICVHIDRR